MSLRTLPIALLAASALTAAAPVAHARDGISPGAAAAIGALGGLAVGGALGAAASQGPYYPGRPVAVVAPPPPPPVYAAPPPESYVEEECRWRRHHFYDAYGNEIVRRERVCD